MIRRAVLLGLLVGTWVGCATRPPARSADVLSLEPSRVDREQGCQAAGSPVLPGELLDTGELTAALERLQPPDGGMVLGFSTDSLGAVSRWRVAETSWPADVAEEVQALTHALIRPEPSQMGRILIRAADGRLAALDTGPSLTCFPSLLNGRAVERALQQLWEETGLAGTATVWLFVDSTGAATRGRINRSSGQVNLDRQLLRATDAMEFRPARLDGAAVSLWVSLPITIEARCPAGDNWAAWARLVRTHPCWRQREVPSNP